MSENDFFIGWSADTPQPDRRFFLGAGIALVGGTALTAGTLAMAQRRAGPGQWNMGEIRTWRGIATAEPYPMLRTADLDGTPRTVLLGCQGKCGVDAKIGALAGQSVVVKGSLIQRDQHAMIAVVDTMDWITATPPSEQVADLIFPEIEPIGEITLSGEILDTKCWFGAMRPSEGKTHKSCASLCIKSGLPPAFYVKAPQDQKALMIMTDRGAAHSNELLPYVADPVEITAMAQRWGDLLLLDGPVSQIQRL